MCANNGISGVPEGVCQCSIPSPIKVGPIEQIFMSCSRYHCCMTLRRLARHSHPQVMNAFPFEDAVVEKCRCYRDKISHLNPLYDSTQYLIRSQVL